MNKLKAIALGALAVFPLASCSLMGTEESLYIESVTAVAQEDGSILVTISFTDDDVKPVTFTVPKGDEGEKGAQGVGIASVDSAQSEDGKDLVITVTYTDPDMQPSIWEIPNANSIDGIVSSYDADTGLTTVTVKTSDGEEHAFSVPKGKDGVGIASVEQRVDDNGDYVITITYTDITRPATEIRLPYKNGEDGRGIDFLESAYDDENYYIVVHYSDSTEETLTFPMPEVEPGTKWYCGSGEPYNIRGAEEGDFYFDYTNGVVYMYQSRAWSILFAMADDPTYYTVTFDVAKNGGHIVQPEIFAPVQQVLSGRPLETIPLAEKENAVFDGWYTSSYGRNDPTATKVTDLTPITKSCTLYACFLEDGE